MLVDAVVEKRLEVAAESGELLDSQILAGLQFFKLGLVYARQVQVVWISLIVERQVEHFFNLKVLVAWSHLADLSRVGTRACKLDLESKPSFVLWVKFAPIKIHKINHLLPKFVELTKTRS